MGNQINGMGEAIQELEQENEKLKEQILKHQIFIGKVAGIIGFDKTVKLLKESDINFKEQT